jgi:CrcB protein
VSLIVLAGVGLLGGLGAVARFAVDTRITRDASSDFPLGTLAVNISGCFLLGVITGAALHGDGYRLAATGFVGAYTTFSTWMFETHLLELESERWQAAVNLALSMVAGLLAVWAGRKLGVALA